MLSFDPEKHLYKWNDEEVPSVTQLLNEFCLIDFSGVPRETLEYKRALGVAVHYAIQLHANDDLDESSLHKDIVPYFEAYKRFREVTGFESVCNEARLYSKKWRFAGTLDELGLEICQMGNVPCLIDYKCTWKLYRSVGPQLEGYRMLVHESLKELNLPKNFKIKKVYGLQLKPTGHYNLEEFNDPNYKQDFLACLWLHWRKRDHYKTGGIAA